MQSLTHHVNEIAAHVHANRTEGQPCFVAIAGAPGSGKSTLATEVARRLNAQHAQTVVVAMDGFHLDNRILEPRGLLQKKGAPETFDASGFMRLVSDLRSGLNVYFPTFDRAQDISIAGAVHVNAATPVIIFEGNYLLFDAPIWRDLTPMWDISVRLDVPIAELRARLIQRWLSHNLSRTAATRRAEINDLPNAQLVMDHALPSDLTLTPTSTDTAATIF